MPIDKATSELIGSRVYLPLALPADFERRAAVRAA